MEEITIEREGHVGILSLAAPQRRNALTPEMSDELVEACEALDADGEIGAVVVRGLDGYFCAGANRDTLAEHGADPLAPDSYRALGAIYRGFARVGELGVPTIAAVRGGAVGAGVNLVFATDLRIVATDARIMSGFLQLGIHPGGGHFHLAGRLGGREAAAGLGLFGQAMSGERAAALGLAWEAVSDDAVEPRAVEIAGAAAADPELARSAVRSLRLELATGGLDWPAALELERAPQAWSFRRTRDRR